MRDGQGPSLSRQGDPTQTWCQHGPTLEPSPLPPSEAMNLSQHFSLEELVRSEAAVRRGLDNTPNAGERMNLVRLCDAVLEPSRELLGVPFHINSGFRTPAVNAAVGSTATNSAHMDGRAADFYPVGMDIKVAFGKLAVSGIPFDQLILECGSWVHIAVARVGMEPRLEVLKASGVPGAWIYEKVAA